MRVFIIAISIFIFTNAEAQSSYTGFIDKYSIQLVLQVYSDGDARAIYVYDKHDTPIVINGREERSILELLEKDDTGRTTAKLLFKNFDKNSKTVSGEWINADSTKRLIISLSKQFDIEYDDNTVWSNRELIQPQSTEKHYFKLLISKESGMDARVTGVKVFEKKTDRLIQKFDLDCQLLGLESISVGDFNFDGIDDFSVFEGSYAGPNTSSIYILRLPDSEKYFISDFSGVSLVFDSEAKQIFERNQCCAGRSIMTSVYKVVDNKMVLLEKECLEYDDEKDDYVKIKCD